MISRRPSLPIFFFGAASGIFLAVLQVLWQFTAPPPRWGLVASIVVAAMSLVGALIVLRRSDRSLGQEGQVSRHWWPSRRAAATWLGVVLVPFAALLVVLATASYSAKAWAIREAGATVGTVTVREILFSDWRPGKDSYYTVRARADIPFRGGARAETGEFRSETELEVGDKILALYAPASPDAGAILGASRSELESQVGGSAGWTVRLGMVVVLFLSLGALLPVGIFSSPTAILRKLAKRGDLNAAACVVTAAGVHRVSESKGSAALRPVLDLRGAHGEKMHLRMDPRIDPVCVGLMLNGNGVTLYWASPSQASQRQDKASAVLVAKEGRCVYGLLQANGESLPAVSTTPPGGQPSGEANLRWLRPFPAWDPALYAGGIRWLLLGAVALLIVTLNVNAFASVVMSPVAISAPFISAWSVGRKRKAYLRSLVPDASLQESPVNPGEQLD